MKKNRDIIFFLPEFYPWTQVKNPSSFPLYSPSENQSHPVTESPLTTAASLISLLWGLSETFSLSDSSLNPWLLVFSALYHISPKFSLNVTVMLPPQLSPDFPLPTPTNLLALCPHFNIKCFAQTSPFQWYHPWPWSPDLKSGNSNSPITIINSTFFFCELPLFPTN